MTPIDLLRTAAALPEAWSSRSLARVGPADVRVLRMDGRPVETEFHATAEVLLVLDGRLELTVEGADTALGPGELYRIPAGVRHAVGPGSRGTLLIVDIPEAP